MTASQALMATGVAASPRATPKRKRDLDDEIPDSTSPLSYSLPTRPFSFEVPSPVSMSRSSSWQGDGSLPLSHDFQDTPTSSPPITFGSSPHSVRFTEKFGKLSIARGSNDTLLPPENVPPSQRPPHVLQETGEGTPDPMDMSHDAKRTKLSPHPAPTLPEPELVSEEISSDVEIIRSSRSGNKSSRSKLTDGRISKSRSPRKRRGGTPEEPTTIIDPVRAALTWQDHEITIYNPDDEDDDGTGVNGIGFKPSAAVAHARLAKRRQQLADYRKREESEARARRSERRRGRSQPAGTGLEPKSPSRRVRFMEPGSAPVEAA